jgi:hypothetical protein
MSSAPRYRIHPAIGIARVGNAAPSDFFLGPELPNQKIKRSPDVGTAVPPFKSDGLVKRQAARFRIWEYVENGGVWSPSREVSLDDDDVAELTWTVHLANRKASFFEFHGLAGSPPHKNDKRRNPGKDERTLEIDPLPRSIGGRSADPVDLSKGTSATPSQERWPDPQPMRKITSLGQLRTDAAGRLIVIPGEGIASGRDKAEIGDYANNNGWFDDVGDGPVTATLKLRTPDGTIAQPQVEGAWVLVGPPDFAPPLPQVVSLYDVLFDLAVHDLPIPNDESVYRTGELARLSGMAKDLGAGTTLSTYKVNFDTDVAPILRAAFVATSVFAPSHRPSKIMGGSGIDADLWAQLSDPDPNTSTRTTIQIKLRKPGTKMANFDTKMPKLLGDDPGNVKGTGQRALTVTPTQWAILERWFDDDFIGSELGPSSLLDPPEAEHLTPHGLDRAALECASGGGFFPGIEVGWLIRQPSVFAEPFRIKHGAPSPYRGDGEENVTVGAGFFSRQMALPWLADFRDCKAEVHPEKSNRPEVWGWWPSQRPDAVLDPSGERVTWHRATGPGGSPRKWRETRTDIPSYQEMIDNWWKFGFIQPVDNGEPITHWQRYREAERADQVLDDLDP